MVASGTLLLGGVRIYGRSTLARTPQLHSNTRSFASLIQRPSANHWSNHASRRTTLALFAARNASTSATTAAEKIAEALATPSGTAEASTNASASTVTEAAANATTTSASNVADVATDVSAPGFVEAATDATVNVANTVPPLNYGDLAAMGFANKTPAGLVQWSMEVINVSTHLPWFYTIIATTAFWKLVTFYPNLVAIRESMKMAGIQTEVNSLREAKKVAQSQGKSFDAKKIDIKMSALYQKADINPLAPVLNGLLQVPLTLGTFFGVRSLANHPLEQLTVSGISWIPDLTVPDPTHILPLLFIAMANFQIYLGKTDSSITSRPIAPHVLNMFHLLTIIPGMLAYYSWSSALTLTLTSGTAFYALQTVLFRNAAFRKRFNIPQYVKGKAPSLLESMKFLPRKVSEMYYQRMADHSAPQGKIPPAGLRKSAKARLR